VKEILYEYFRRVDVMKTVTGLVMLTVFSLLVRHLVTHELPEPNREVIIHILGIIEGAVMAVVTYYFGSSKGSQEKAEQLKKASEKLTP
jgi:uncharacterized protein YacL